MVDINKKLHGCRVVFANKNINGYMTELILENGCGKQYFLHADIGMAGTCITVVDGNGEKVI